MERAWAAPVRIVSRVRWEAAAPLFVTVVRVANVDMPWKGDPPTQITIRVGRTALAPVASGPPPYHWHQPEVRPVLQLGRCVSSEGGVSPEIRNPVWANVQLENDVQPTIVQQTTS